MGTRISVQRCLKRYDEREKEKVKKILELLGEISSYDIFSLICSVIGGII